MKASVIHVWHKNRVKWGHLVALEKYKYGLAILIIATWLNLILPNISSTSPNGSSLVRAQTWTIQSGLFSNPLRCQVMCSRIYQNFEKNISGPLKLINCVQFRDDRLFLRHERSLSEMYARPGQVVPDEVHYQVRQPRLGRNLRLVHRQPLQAHHSPGTVCH